MPPTKTYGSLNPLLNIPTAPKTTPTSGVPVTQPIQPTYKAPTKTAQSIVTNPYDALMTQAKNIQSQIPTATGMSTPATVYGADLNSYNASDPYDTELGNQTKNAEVTANQTVSPERIYRDKLKLYQKEIDAVNQLYAQKINTENIAGQGRLGSGRAIQARSGLLGSDFGSAQNDTIGQYNSDIVSGLQGEQNTMIQSILGKARKDATEEAAAKTLAKSEGAASYLKFLGEQSTRKAAKFEDFLATLGDTDLSKINPTNLAEVAKSYGVSVDTLKTKVKEAKDATATAAKEADLKNRKGEADIAKIEADIASGKLITMSEGNKLFNTETGEVVAYNPKTYAPKAQTGGVGSGIYGQLDYRTANAVIAQGNKFAESPIVKTYNNFISAGNLISGVSPNSKNPADHQAIIYNFAKALDPDSVVREGEYATIQKYSQNIASKYKGQINQAVNGNGFLSPEAIKSIQAATANRVKAYTPQYTNFKTQTAQRINSIAGADVANQVLLDFESGYTDPTSLGVNEPSGDPEYDAYLQSIGQ
jgi:hypothetical protein